MEKLDKLIEANERLFKAICNLHPFIQTGNDKEVEMYLAMHTCKGIIKEMDNVGHKISAGFQSCEPIPR